MNTKYVKVWADRDRYRQKILDAKEDIARFNVLVEEKALKKAETFIQEFNNLKKSLKKKDVELDESKKHNSQLK